MRKVDLRSKLKRQAEKMKEEEKQGEGDVEGPPIKRPRTRYLEGGGGSFSVDIWIICKFAHMHSTWLKYCRVAFYSKSSCTYGRIPWGVITYFLFCEASCS